MRVIAKLLIALSLVLSVGCGVHVPQSSDRAKRVIERNYNQIKAISDFHDLGDPTIVKDTLRTVIPSYFKTINIKDDVSFLSQLNKAFALYVSPSVKDSVDLNKIKEGLYKELKPDFIDKTYEDSTVIVHVTGYQDDLNINVKVKEKVVENPIEYKQTVIDTEVKWYEDRFVKIAMILVIGGAFAAIIISLIKKGAV